MTNLAFPTKAGLELPFHWWDAVVPILLEAVGLGSIWKSVGEWAGDFGLAVLRVVLRAVYLPFRRKLNASVLFERLVGGRYLALGFAVGVGFMP